MQDFKIRLIEREDLDFIREIRSDPETTKYLGTFELLSKEKQEKWFEGLLNDNSRMYFIFELNKKRIGYLRITVIDYINRSMCVGGDIHKKFRGKGYSKKMFDLIFDLGFYKMNFNKMWLYALESNARARHIYKKLGFKENGISREAVYKDGKYLDYIYMDILCKEMQIEKER